jgi:hypothetical protein
MLTEPVQVVKTQSGFNCDELEIQFVDQFELVWSDEGSGEKYYGAFYKPTVTDNYYALGYYRQNNYSTPTGSVVVAKDLGANYALTRPDDYKLIWTDEGSGAKKNGAFWLPVPQPGYVALGLVVSSNYVKPSLDAVMCVRRDLTVPGKPGDQVWVDSGTGAKDDFGSWEINTPDVSRHENAAYIAAGTFFGVASHTPPDCDPALNCLSLQIPYPQAFISQLFCYFRGCSQCS